jgi:tRNA A-37 threonylcarbamoyl transferase component Bud32
MISAAVQNPLAAAVRPTVMPPSIAALLHSNASSSSFNHVLTSGEVHVLRNEMMGLGMGGQQQLTVQAMSVDSDEARAYDAARAAGLTLKEYAEFVSPDGKMRVQILPSSPLTLLHLLRQQQYQTKASLDALLEKALTAVSTLHEKAGYTHGKLNARNVVVRGSSFALIDFSGAQKLLRGYKLVATRAALRDYATLMRSVGGAVSEENRTHLLLTYGDLDGEIGWQAGVFRPQVTPDRDCFGPLERMFQERLACGTYGCTYVTGSTAANRVLIHELLKLQRGIEVPPATQLILKVTAVNGDAPQMKNELAIAKEAGDLGIGPKVFYSEQCSNFHVIAMERYSTTAKNYMRTDPTPANIKELCRRLKSLVDKLHSQMAVYHNDLHPSNVVLKITPQGEIEDVRLIDFGLASPTEGATVTFGDFEDVYLTIVYLLDETDRMELDRELGFNRKRKLLASERQKQQQQQQQPPPPPPPPPPTPAAEGPSLTRVLTEDDVKPVKLSELLFDPTADRH